MSNDAAIRKSSTKAKGVVRYFASSIAITTFSMLSALPLQAEPNNLPLCYMITSSGRLINLDSLCIQGSINNYYEQLDRLTRPRFNYQQFQSLKDGMRYKKVIEILGEGTEVSRSNIGDTETVGYVWKNSNGSNIRVIFQDNDLVVKSQSGLQ